MLDAWANPRKRIQTLILLAIFCLLMVAAGLVGVSDNPPGILLAYGAATFLVLAFVHPWRTVKKFGLLLLASALGFVVFAVLHNLLEIGAQEMGGSDLLQGLIQGFAVAAFLVALLICPPGILVGFVGAIIMSVRRERE